VRNSVAYFGSVAIVNDFTGSGRVFRELCEYEVMRWEGREVEKYMQLGHWDLTLRGPRGVYFHLLVCSVPGTRFSNVDNAWQRKTRVIAYEMAGSKFPDFFEAWTTKVGSADRRKSGCTESGTTTQLGAQLQTLVAYENQIAVTKTRSSMWHSKRAHFFGKW